MRSVLLVCALCCSIGLWGQATFKAGWSTYQTGYVIHEYTYNYTVTDSLKLTLADSALILLTADSLVAYTVHIGKGDKAIHKTLECFNPGRQMTKNEEYNGDNLLLVNEWKYDEKGRKVFHSKEDKVRQSSTRENFEYTTDKKTGELVIQESSYNNGRIEFYTKSYYNKKNEKYKEVRLNDNNKDVVHIESFTYADNGKVKERSVYFPEWKVTKHFEEKEGKMPAKCFRWLAMGVVEKPTLAGRVQFIRKVFGKNLAAFTDGECEEFEYKLSNKQNCEMIVNTSKTTHTRQIIFRYKDKI